MLWIKFKVQTVGPKSCSPTTFSQRQGALGDSHFLACLKRSVSAQPEGHFEHRVEIICSLFTILSMKFCQRCPLHKLAPNTNNWKNTRNDDCISSLCLIGYSGMCVIHSPYTSFNLKFRVFWAHLWFWESFRLEPDGAGWDKGTVASSGTVNTCLSFPSSRTSGLPLMPSLCTLSVSSC